MSVEPLPVVRRGARSSPSIPSVAASSASAFTADAAGVAPRALGVCAGSVTQSFASAVAGTEATPRRARAGATLLTARRNSDFDMGGSTLPGVLEALGGDHRFDPL